MIENIRDKFEGLVTRKARTNDYKYIALMMLKRDGEGYATTWVDSFYF